MTNLDVLLDKLAAPARRALLATGVKSLNDLANFSEKEVSGWHGIGKTALSLITQTMAENELRFKTN